ncbi:hypothetical protein BH09GEM1_BH09GEM1_07280 [soil metagenome]
MCTAALIKDVQAKIVEALDCQTNAYLLTWGCALVAVLMPQDGIPDLSDPPRSLLEPTMTLPVPPTVQAELALEVPQVRPDGAPEWLWEPEGPVAPMPPLPSEGADAEVPDQGFMLVTYGGEALWLTPTHLKALVEAGPLVYGRVDWHATLGFRSSNAPYVPLVDMNVECIAQPSVSVSSKRPQYGWSQYVHAARHHQDLVLLTGAKPEGFPW